MANNIFNRLNGGRRPQGGPAQQPAPAPGGRNLAPALLRHIQSFQGNPIQQVQQKLQSGEMSQQQYNQLHSMAEQIAQKMMGVLGSSK